MHLGWSKKKKNKSESDLIVELKHAIESADAIVIGAGSGLSTAAGFQYDGERFERYFGDFKMKYHFEDMYSGGFIHIQAHRSTGHTGAGISTSTAI